MLTLIQKDRGILDERVNFSLSSAGRGVGLWRRALPRPVTTLIRATVGSGLSPHKVETVALEPKSKLGKTKGAEKEDIESESKGNSINQVEGNNDVEDNDLNK